MAAGCAVAASDAILTRALPNAPAVMATDGLGRSAATPLLAGQSEAYLLESLRAYAGRTGQAVSCSMPALAVDSENLPELARHFAALPPPAEIETRPDADMMRRGEEIARNGTAGGKCACLPRLSWRRRTQPALPEDRWPAGRLYRHPAPAVSRWYTAAAPSYSHLMTNAAKGLTDKDIAALSAYFSNFTARRLQPQPADRV